MGRGANFGVGAMKTKLLNSGIKFFVGSEGSIVVKQ